MLEYVISQWKQKKGTICLIVLGFFIGNLVLSFGTSISVENIKQSYDRTSGNPEKQLELEITASKQDCGEEARTVCENLSKYGEIQILSFEKIPIGNGSKQYQAVPVCFNSEESWHIPIMEGRYFWAEENWDEKEQIIVGKTIAESNNFKVGDSIMLQGKKFEIIGICGRENRSTQWDEIVYFPWRDFCESYQSFFHTNWISLILKSGKETLIENFSEEETKASELGMELTYTYMNEVESDSTNNSILITIVASVLVFTIAMINISNLMIYWTLERRKDLAILKAMGADNQYLIKGLLVEILVMTILSAIGAILLQKVITFGYGDILRKNEIYATVTYINFVIGFLVTVICGGLAVIIPARQVMCIQPSESIKE